MGGLTPGIGGTELIVIGIVALLVVGPKDLPVLMRRVGQALAKARAMASDFRASFDEMARQSELDDLRKEVEALRQGQTMMPLGAEAHNAFRDIKADLNQPLIPAEPPLPAPPATPTPDPEPVVTGASEWPDSPPPAKPARKPRAAAAKPKTPTAKAAPRAASAKPAPAKAATVKAAPKRAAAPKAAADKPVRKPRTRKAAI